MPANVKIIKRGSRGVSKYRNKKCEYDGYKFDSIKEKNRYIELKLMEKAGEIRKLELQPRFDFKINGVNCGFYKADFKYNSKFSPCSESPRVSIEGVEFKIVEDCKGFKTPVYNLKKRLMKAIHGIDIYET